ncbi:TatD family [Corchorus olitorius]|uniref:TatD family n=1 Tax=Corchorus olitorius TaxID=93759 RepID=A0A1R3H591_9ROSI|nr:TatD family [Corchorus olitorius]
MAMKLFDAHCHLQDQRILDKAPQLIATAIEAGVVHFAVNGITEKDWHLVKEMSDEYCSVIPNFGLHPWFVGGKSDSWFNTLKQFFEANPSAAVGEIGLDKVLAPKGFNFTDQLEVFKKQLELAKELNRPASVHCIGAFPELLQIMK